jgi:ABC-type uncharacterized transport system permease subunit
MNLLKWLAAISLAIGVIALFIASWAVVLTVAAVAAGVAVTIFVVSFVSYGIKDYWDSKEKDR